MDRRRTELGDFLRSRRAGLRPGDIGLRDYGGRRRVPGLRREELAQLAGVSAGYYTKLEQGHSSHASEAVLDALARVLRLDEAERAHLHQLARQRPAALRRAAPERLRPGVRLLIERSATPRPWSSAAVPTYWRGTARHTPCSQGICPSTPPTGPGPARTW